MLLLFWANCESGATKGPVPAWSSAPTPGPRRLALQSQRCRGRLEDLRLLHRRQSSGADLFSAAVSEGKWWAPICTWRKKKKPTEGQSPLHTLSWTLCCCTSASYTVHIQAVCLSSASSPCRHAAGNKSALLTCEFALRLHPNGRCICQRKRTDYLDERKKKKISVRRKNRRKKPVSSFVGWGCFWQRPNQSKRSKGRREPLKINQTEKPFSFSLNNNPYFETPNVLFEHMRAIKIGRKKKRERERQENLIKNVE